MAKKSESYESRIKKLEDIVRSMESSELTLEESMKKYEEGILLCNTLYTTLNEVEGRIKILTSEGEKDFIKDEE